MTGTVKQYHYDDLGRMCVGTKLLEAGESGAILVIYNHKPIWVPAKEYEAFIQPIVTKALENAKEVFFNDILPTLRKT